jgi:hypothetical protein
MAKNKKPFQFLDFISTLFAICVFVYFVFYGSMNMLTNAFEYGLMFHNVDLAYNMCIITNYINDINEDQDCDMNTDYRTWKDRHDLNETVLYTDSYITSNKQYIQFSYDGLLRSYVWNGNYRSYVCCFGITRR